MATEATIRSLLLGRERPLTATAHLRVVIDDLIHLIRRLQLTAGATMPALPALLAPLALCAQQLLGLRPRLRAPLRPRLGRIGRRRLRTRPRVLTRRRLHTTQTLIHLAHASAQIEHELHTRLTTRVVYRLRLGTLHDRKIRCNKQEPSPSAPTTERLRVFAF